MCAAAAGYNATVNGACQEGTKWVVEAVDDLLDATTFCTGGYREYVKGLKSATFTIESLDIIAGIDGVSVAFVNDNVSITGTVLVGNQTFDTSVDGLVTFVYKGNFNGSYVIA